MIPTRDRWPVLARTLEALIGQTVQGFETVVVIDGHDQQPPEPLPPPVRSLAQEHGGPGAARNLAAGASSRPLLLFLGDDMIAAPQLVARHLERHARNPDTRVAVLGDVRWHPSVARGPLMHWLDFSDAQFDFGPLRAAPAEEAGWGRFYSCNVSLKRRLFQLAGGFDPDFRFDYEDLDLAYRLHRQGLRLQFEPAALAYHLHRHSWATVEQRYRSRAAAERLMAAKHPDWFKPWFHTRLSAEAAERPVGKLWPWLALATPPRPRRIRAAVRRRADRRYHQRLAPAFLAAWEQAGVAEARRVASPAAPAGSSGG